MAANSQRSSKLKKRLKAGGIIGGLAALLVWLASMLPGLGLGFGGKGEGKGDGTAKSTEQKSQPVPPPKKKIDEPKKVVVVRIDSAGVRFRHQRDGTTTFEAAGAKQEAAIAEVIRRAKQVPGDDAGYRVHIYFHGSGYKETLDALTKALSDAGIKYPPPYKTFKMGSG